MMLISLRKISFLLLLIPQFLFSGNNDSLSLKKTPTTLFFFQQQFESTDSIAPLDNSLTNFQNYLPRNHLGNTGLPYNSLFPPSDISPSGFNYSKNNYSNYFFSPQKIKFYSTRTPYTDLFYVLGSKNEQIFKVTFSYNVRKNWNVATDFHRLRSIGFYTGQITNDNIFDLNSNFKSLNNRYYFLASIIYNSAKNQESGGLRDDSTFTNTSVNLSGAKRTMINKSVFFKQYFNLGQKSIADEDDTLNLRSIIPASRFILTSLFENNIMKYEDTNPLSGYYSKIYLDSTLTFDSISTNKLENELAWKRLDNNKHRGVIDIFGSCFNVKHQFITVKQNTIDTAFNNIMVGADFYNTYSKNTFWWNLSSKYTVTGYNKNNYFVNLSLKKEMGDSLNILVLKAGTNSHSPDFIYNHYSSNNFKWNNNFSETQESSADLNFSALKHRFSIGGNITNYYNAVYYWSSANPQQAAGQFSVIGAYLKKDLTLYKFHLNSKVNYQYVRDQMAIRLPEFILDHSLFYASDMFKAAMNMQIGFNFYYTSAYYANAYMPATGQFYLQDNRQYGNYPFIDFFVNAKIKSARIFFKIDHLNSGFSGTNYSLTPHYPQNTRAFKLGISWRFFD